MTLVALALTASACWTPQASCADWVPTFGENPDPSIFARTSIVFDDGSGPALYVAGRFQYGPSYAGALPIEGIARWSQDRWHSVGGGVNGEIYAMTVFDDGSGPALYVGGALSRAGTTGISYLARWNGSAWSVVGGLGQDRTSGSVTTLAVLDDGSGPALFVGGTFGNLNSLTAHRIARWDGTSWSALGSGLDIQPNALATFDDGSGPALYAAGTFSQAGGTPVNRIARWDGTSWSAVASGFDDIVRTLQVFDDGSGPALYAGGLFTRSGAQPMNHVARWNGTSWSAVGGGLRRAVTAFGIYDDGHGPALFAGGRGLFLAPQGEAFLARWNGTSWSPAVFAAPLPDYGASDFVLTLTSFDDGGGSELCVGGASFYAPDEVGDAVSVMRWNGSRWARFGHGLDNVVRVLTVFDDGGGPALYAGGDFLHADGVPLRHAAKWNGSSWTALGSGPVYPVQALATFDDGSGPALYASRGSYESASSAGYVDRWDGTNWTTISDLFDLPVLALASFDDGAGPALFAGGYFSRVGDVFCSGLARWDGSAWTPVAGTPRDAKVRSLLAFDDGSGPALYVGGDFSISSPHGQRGPRRWNGASWSTVGTDVDMVVYAMIAFDGGGGPPSLIVSGSLELAGAVPAHVARWDGASWSALAATSNFFPATLAVFDDGSGPAIYAGGNESSSPADRVPQVLRFDGTSWSHVGHGTSLPRYAVGEPVLALAAFDAPGPLGPALFMGGQFESQLDTHDSFLARYQGCLDTLAPVLTTPEHVYVLDPFGTGPGEIVRFTVTASDDRAPAPIVVCNPPSGSFFVRGTTIVHCTATDSAGNVTSRQFPVVVQPKFDRGGR